MTGQADSVNPDAPLMLALLWFQRHQIQTNPAGLIYATLSGRATSALGYVVWYWVRVRMAAIIGGTVQLSVPVLSSAGPAYS